MAVTGPRKRKVEDGIRGQTGRPKKRFRKQTDYHSSSEESEAGSEGGFAPVNLLDSDDEEQTEAVELPTIAKIPHDTAEDSLSSLDNDSAGAQSSEDDDGEEDDIEGPGATEARAKRKPTSKRNDPEAFSTSISKILSTKLSQAARKDPVLSRSREAAETSTGIANERLEKRAKAKLRADRKEDLERGRFKDVLGLTTGDAGETAEQEKRLRKIAQRGVVKLFNAVRAAQIRGEEAAKEEKKKGTVGLANREEKVNELTKQGFLDLIGGKGKRKPSQDA